MGMLDLPRFTNHEFPVNLGNSILLPFLHNLTIETSGTELTFQYPLICPEAIGGDQQSPIRKAFMKGRCERTVSLCSCSCLPTQVDGQRRVLTSRIAMIQVLFFLGPTNALISSAWGDLSS